MKNPDTNWRLDGNVALVTGAGRGIGRATAEVLAERGAHVWLMARSAHDLEPLAEQITAAGGAATVAVGDVTSTKDRERITTRLAAEHGRLEILVNNAGFNLRKPAIAYDPEETRSILETNLLGAFELTRALHPLLAAAATASVVNVSSVAGQTHLRTGVPYAMSKAALNQMTRNLACEWAAEGIRVNAVAPWYIETPLASQVLADEDYRAEVLERTPMGRIGRPEEVAATITFLCLAGAGYITGQVVSVDGGFSVYGF